ncbi:MAG TPA: DUF2779 domain-containing protein [Ignavibacteriaceae bacterium]|nr:DUF2779 domain-containing protein [Ignavibacteriaceae bacterium]
MPTHLLSKSTFIRGLQCEKNLFLYKYHPELADEISDAQQAIFDRGTNVGLLAQQLFPGGVNCAPPNHFQYDQCIEKTKKAIADGVTTLYEAGFVFDEVLVICDILVKEKGTWHIYEVKSSTSVSEVYLNDAAIQFYVVKNSIPDVKEISIVYLNNQYVRMGEVNINELFSIENVNEFAAEREDFVKENIARFKEVIMQKKEPKIDIGPHCNDPYPCPFIGHCWQHIPEYSVFNISYLKSDRKFELYKQGILKLTDIPDDYPLGASQRLQVDCEKNKKSVIDKAAIGEFLSLVEYPVAYMDFETMMPAVPMFDNSRPYQQIPFQYSVHYQKKKDSELIHKEYLAESDCAKDPRKEFIEKLLSDLNGANTIIVYNQAFEITRLNEIARDFPQYEVEIEKVISKIIDLMKPFQNKSYYTPEMKGSYSIKAVLPALIPEMKYEDLAISDGGTASRIFESLFNNCDLIRQVEIRNALYLYCKLDSLGMEKIINKLFHTIKPN